MLGYLEEKEDQRNYIIIDEPQEDNCEDKENK